MLRRILLPKASPPPRPTMGIQSNVEDAIGIRRIQVPLFNIPTGLWKTGFNRMECESSLTVLVPSPLQMHVLVLPLPQHPPMGTEPGRDIDRRTNVPLARRQVGDVVDASFHAYL